MTLEYSRYSYKFISSDYTLEASRVDADKMFLEFASKLAGLAIDAQAPRGFFKARLREVMYLVTPARWKQIRAMILAELYKQMCYGAGTLLEVKEAEQAYGKLLPLDNSKEYASTKFKEA